MIVDSVDTFFSVALLCQKTQKVLIDSLVCNLSHIFDIVKPRRKFFENYLVIWGNSLVILWGCMVEGF